MTVRRVGLTGTALFVKSVSSDYIIDVLKEKKLADQQKRSPRSFGT